MKYFYWLFKIIPHEHDWRIARKFSVYLGDYSCSEYPYDESPYKVYIMNCTKCNEQKREQNY